MLLTTETTHTSRTSLVGQHTPRTRTGTCQYAIIRIQNQTPGRSSLYTRPTRSHSNSCIGAFIVLSTDSDTPHDGGHNASQRLPVGVLDGGLHLSAVPKDLAFADGDLAVGHARARARARPIAVGALQTRPIGDLPQVWERIRW
jgi:hypothetical protein